MLKYITITVALVVVAIAAVICFPRSQSGDFVGWMIKETTDYGGRAITNATLPTLETRWRVRRDKNGFEVQLPNAEFSAVDAALRRAFGTPQNSRTQSLDEGPRSAVWAAKDVGAAILLIDFNNRIKISCVRGMRGLGEMMDEVEKPWWKKIRLW